MDRRIIMLFAMTVVLTGIAIAAQAPPDPELRDAITVMRAINTAENAVRQTGGKYAPLVTLVDQAFMKGVRPNIVVNGDVVTYMDAQLRLVLPADALQYQVMVMPRQSCGVAVFSDERGVIYTGKGLGC